MEGLLLDLSINVTVDVPRPDVLRGVPREGRAGAAHVSVHADLVRGLLDGRGGLLAGDPARGGRAVRAHADLRDRHQRARARDGARGRLPARADEAVHAELSPRRRQARLLGVLRRRVRRRALLALARRERRLRAAQPRDGRRVQRVQRHPLPQRDDLLRPRAAGARARPVLRQPRAVRHSRARPQGVDRASRGYADRYEEIDAEERIYRKVA